MSTQIGSVTLDNDMVWTDEFLHSWLNSSVEATTGGGVVVQEFAKSEHGRPITLATQDGHGYQKRSTVRSLADLAKTAGSTMTLTITNPDDPLDVTTKRVRFRTEIEGGPVQFSPSFTYDNIPSEDFYYEGVIYLMVI